MYFPSKPISKCRSVIFAFLKKRIYFFEVNTKNISSNVLKISVISRVGSTSEIAAVFNT